MRQVRDVSTLLELMREASEMRDYAQRRLDVLRSELDLATRIQTLESQSSFNPSDSESLMKAVLDFVESHPGAGTKTIRHGVTGRNTTIDLAITQLVKRGLLRTDRGRGRLIRHYATALEASHPE